jgi:hypothetical protein
MAHDSSFDAQPAGVEPAVADADGRLPNLVIAGVSKAGTTSLFNYLGQHPEIGTSDVKELRYFSPLRHGGTLEPIETYTRHFRDCLHTRYALEATPGYFYGGSAVARALSQTCPDVRVIVSLRSPPERCWSWYRFVKSRLRIPRDMGFEDYLDRCAELHRAGVDGTVENQPFWGLGGGCYARWLDAWSQELGDRLRIVFFEDLAADPGGLVGSLLAWAGLDPEPLASLQFTAENQTVQYRSKALQQVAVRLNRRSERFFRRHVAAKRMLRSTYWAFNRAPEERGLPAASRARLDDFYAPHNERLDRQLAALGIVVPRGWHRAAG